MSFLLPAAKKNLTTTLKYHLKIKMIQNKNQDKQNNQPETTGHEWDGIQEYNTPAPRWWLIVWMISIIWAIVYWFFFPTWPTISGNTKGLNNWTKQSELKESLKEVHEKREIYLEKFSNSSFAEIQKNPELMEFALVGGKIAFKENCAACHGTGAAGGKGFPNLNDDDWLWGGKIEDIYTTLLYGIRSTHEKTRSSVMPAFGRDQILNKEEIENVANYVIEFSDKSAANIKANSKGREIFKNQCAVCHGADGKGSKAVGAPNLTDPIWLYGKSKDDILYTITNSRAGVMPTWKERLDDQTIRQLALYIHSLGGGE